jgi:hypothetical protein
MQVHAPSLFFSFCLPLSSCSYHRLRFHTPHGNLFQPLQHLDQISQNTHSGDICAGTVEVSNPLAKRIRSETKGEKKGNASEELPRSLDDEGIVAVSLSVEADDVVAALQASD